MRSSTQAANCEVTGTCSLRAIRYGRTNSPGRPNSVIAVKPMTVAESRFRIEGFGFSGRRNTAQRSARP